MYIRNSKYHKDKVPIKYGMVKKLCKVYDRDSVVVALSIPDICH